MANKQTVEFKWRVIKIFFDCLIWKETPDLKCSDIVEGKTRNKNKVYYFYKDKIEKYNQELCDLYGFIDNTLSKDLSFEDLKHLKNGTDWTKMRQYLEFFTSLLYANESLVYMEENNNNPKIWATDIPELKLVDTKRIH